MSHECNLNLPTQGEEGHKIQTLFIKKKQEYDNPYVVMFSKVRK